MFLVGFFYLCCFCLCDLSSFLWAHFYCHPIFHFLLIYLYISLVYFWVGFLFSFPFPFDTTYYEVMLESMCVFFCLPVLDFFIHLYFKVSPPRADFSLTFSTIFSLSLWPCFAFPSVPLSFCPQLHDGSHLLPVMFPCILFSVGTSKPHA